MHIKIDKHVVGPDYQPLIIAELSANHNGSLEKALDAIETAKLCGAGAIKLQTYTADTLTIDCDKPDFMIKGGLWNDFKLYDLYKWAHTPYEWHPALFEKARKVGITVFSTPFDETAVELLESLNCPAYKIASFEIVDLPLITCVAKTGKPIIMSTGMASEEEIGEAVSTARKAGATDLILLHCISSYPTPINNANLSQIPELARRFGTLVGLSDHTMGTTVSVSSVALGACVIEKHFTLNRSDKGPDSEFSLEPKELERLCRDCKDAWLSLGRPGFARQSVEEASRVFRRSIYFVRDLSSGQVIGPKDIRRIRPGFGLAPKYFELILGRRVKKDITFGTPVAVEDLEPPL